MSLFVGKRKKTKKTKKQQSSLRFPFPPATANSGKQPRASLQMTDVLSARGRQVSAPSLGKGGRGGEQTRVCEVGGDS